MADAWTPEEVDAFAHAREAAEEAPEPYSHDARIWDAAKAWCIAQHAPELASVQAALETAIRDRDEESAYADHAHDEILALQRARPQRKTLIQVVKERLRR